MSTTQQIRRNFSPVKRRILQYLEYKSISRYCFYRDSGITRGVLEQPTGISEENIEKFIRYARDISLDWLLRGRGSMCVGEDVLSAAGNYFPEIKKIATASDVSMPYHTDYPAVSENRYAKTGRWGVWLYELDGHSGLSQLFRGEAPPECTVGQLHIPGLPMCDGALHIRGETRCAPLKNGDIAIYKVLPSADTLIFGELYLLSIEVGDEEFTMIRYLRRGDASDSVVLDQGHGIQSDVQEIPRERIRALALVKAAVRFNTLR